MQLIDLLTADGKIATSSGAFKKLKEIFSDADRVRDKINEGLKDAATQISGGNQKSTAFSDFAQGSMKAILNSAYDRLGNEAYRMGKNQLGSIFEDMAKEIASLNYDGVISKFIGGILGKSAKAAEDIAKISDKAIEIAKAKGGIVGELGNSMQETILQALPKATEMGVTVNELMESTQKMLVNSGRIVTYSKETLTDALTSGKAFTEYSGQILENGENFRNVGIGLAGATENINKIGAKSVAIGLNAKEVTKTVMANLDKLNEYGFKNGVEGLSRMVQEAQSLNMKMDSVFKIAEKGFSPESAIELSAKLSVIGGAVGAFKDVPRLMYDTTNDAEDLQKSLLEAASSLATYNTETKQFEVSGANMRRAHEMAAALGMDMKDLNSLAKKAAAKMEAMGEIDMMGNMSDDQKEFIANMAQVGKNGEMVIHLPKDIKEKMGFSDTIVNLKDLSADQVDNIKKLQEEMAEKAESPEEIAKDQLNEMTRLSNLTSAIYYQLGNLIHQRGAGAREKIGLTAKGLSGSSDLLMSTIFSKIEAGERARLASQFGTDIINLKPKNEPSKEQSDLFDKVKNNLKKVFEDQKKKEDREAGKDITGKLDVNLKITSDNNMDIAGRMDKDPKFRADFVDSITESARSYFSKGEVIEG
jgi:hypothetical protein